MQQSEEDEGRRKVRARERAPVCVCVRVFACIWEGAGAFAYIDFTSRDEW